MKRTQLTTTADLTREEVDFFIKEAENLRDKRTKDLDNVIVASLFMNQAHAPGFHSNPRYIGLVEE